MKSWKKLLSAVLALSLAIPGIAMPTEVQAAETNLALAGTATASSYESGTEYTAAKTNDGDTSTTSHWGTGQNAAVGEWLQIDLGSICTINSIVINFERTDDAQNILGYHVDIDGETVYTKSEKAKQVETISFDTAKTGQVVKLVIDAADGGILEWVNVGVTEFQIFGESTGEVDTTVVTTENVNHVLSASLTASSEEVASFGAANAGDGDESTRWSSDGSGASEEWLKATFTSPTQIKHIRVKMHPRNVEPTPSNLEQLSIRYTDADGNTQYAKQNVANTVEGNGHSTYMSIVLDEAIIAKSIELCDFVANAASWNNIGITEFEAYSNEQIEPVDPIDEITVELPEEGNKLIVDIPESEEFDITYNGTDYEQVIGDDLTIYTPIVDTTVKVSFKSVNKTDASDYEFKEFEVTVPGIYTQGESDNAAPAVLPELREWKGYTGEFTVAENAKVVIAGDDLKATADAFAADYLDITGSELTVVTGTIEDAAEGDFFFALTEDETKGLDDEGYLMEIKDKVTVEAEDTTGAYWATRTILQALKSGDMTIPKGITRDYPLYKVRGIILDVGRKTFKLDFLQQMAKQLSWYKMNDFHVHLNDNLIFLEDCRTNGKDPAKAYSGFRLESDVKAGDTVELEAVENDVKTKKTFTYQADLTSKDVFYTKDDFRNFMQEAAAMGVNVVPEFDTPAHALAFTKVIPELSLGEGVRNGRGLEELDLTNQYEESLDFVTNVFDEYMAADMENPVFTEGGVVHVGCDEYFGENEAFRKYCRDIADYVESTGRTARLWGSLSAKRGTTEVDGTGIQMNMWSSQYALADEMYELGFDMIDCNEGPYYIVPNAGYYNDYLNASTMYNDKLNDIAGVSFPAGDKQILGGSYALWNDMVDIYDNGISEYDCYRRLTSNMGLFAAKAWGKGELTLAEATEIQKAMGDAPNTDFHYETKADENGNVLSWDVEDFETMSGEGAVVVTEGRREVLRLNGETSYVETGAGTLGLDNQLTVFVKRASDSTEDQILFESVYGSIKAVQGTTGMVGITRENRDYSFDYELPVGKWVKLTIENRLEEVSLYVNGKLTDTIGDDERCVVTKGNGNVSDRPLLATCMLPMATIGSKTNAFDGFVASVEVSVASEYYDYKKVTVTASSEETVGENAPAAHVSDGNESTIWHSKWKDGEAQPPHWIQLELADVTKIDQVVYVPRQNATNGIFTEYKLEISVDGKIWTPVAESTWEKDATAKVVELTPVEAKFVKLTASSADSNFGSAAEIKLHVYKEPQDYGKTELEALITEANKLTASDYTTESWADFEAALEEAIEVSNDDEANQDAVDPAIVNLQEAMEALEEKPKNKWVQDEKGWKYRDANGNYLANCWAFINGEWYWFGADSYMKTGWIYIQGEWYYLNISGAMETGWIKLGSTWYYLNTSGAMATGWVKDGATWYYMNTSGAMVTGWVKDGATWYYMNTSGAMVTGWLQQGSTWYYLKADGAMAVGKLKIANRMNSFASSGAWLGYI